MQAPVDAPTRAATDAGPAEASRSVATAVRGSQRPAPRPPTALATQTVAAAAPAPPVAPPPPPLAPLPAPPVLPPAPPVSAAMGGGSTSVSGGGQQDTGPPVGVMGVDVVTPMPPGSSGGIDDLIPSVIGVAENPGSRPT